MRNKLTCRSCLWSDQCFEYRICQHFTPREEDTYSEISYSRTVREMQNEYDSIALEQD